MHIVVIEPDSHEREFVIKKLETGTLNPKPIITAFGGVGEFLEKYAGLEKPFVLVLEIILPLFPVEGPESENQIIKRVDALKTRFPWLKDNWDGIRGGEVLIGGLRNKEGDNLPIIICTNIDWRMISDEIWTLDWVYHCYKTIELSDLMGLISQVKACHPFYE